MNPKTNILALVGKAKKGPQEEGESFYLHNLGFSPTQNTQRAAPAQV
jgi:hypothetical protein